MLVMSISPDEHSDIMQHCRRPEQMQGSVAIVVQFQGFAAIENLESQIGNLFSMFYRRLVFL